MTEDLPVPSGKNHNETPDWRKHFELFRKVQEINKDMTPEEAFERILEHNRYMDSHPLVNQEVRQAQRAFMERSGINPDEWTYYTSKQPADTEKMEFTEEDMKRATENFPEGFEFFATPGELMTHLDPTTGQPSVSISPFHWSIYIRKRLDLYQIGE